MSGRTALTAAKHQEPQAPSVRQHASTLLKNKVHLADIHDRLGAEPLLSGLKHLVPAIEPMWAATAYRGLKDWLRRTFG
jgi:hypothetical protein